MGFAELVVIAIVGLLVVGPERLPHALKSGMKWMAKIKHLINQTKSEFEQQLGVDDIRREIHNEQVLASLEQLKASRETLAKEAAAMDKSVRALAEDISLGDEGLFGEQLGNHPEKEPTLEDNAAHAREAEQTNKPTQKETSDTAPPVEPSDTDPRP
ncbi:MAG: sec-independent protein translocase protein TatB [Lentisphaeria bacterium]|jgi:sec-independent protein translocase protein TatB